MIRLPPYHSSLNPIEFLWGDLKKRLRDASTSDTKIDKVEELTKKFLMETPKSRIENYCNHVMHVEKEFVQMEGIRLGPSERFVISLDDSDDDDHEDSDEETVLDDEDEENEEEQRIVNSEDKENAPVPVQQSPSPIPTKKSFVFDQNLQMPFF